MSHHEIDAKLSDLGPFKIVLDKQHGEYIGFTCPHNKKKPVGMCRDCGASFLIHEGLLSPEADRRYTDLGVRFTYDFQVRVVRGNPKHKCTPQNPLCQTEAER